MINGFDEVQKAGQENLNRALQSFSALSRGWQALANEAAGFSKQAFEEGTAHLEKLMGAKTPDVALRTQTEYLRNAYDKAAGQAARIGELYLDVVKDAAKPFESAVPTARK